MSTKNSENAQIEAEMNKANEIADAFSSPIPSFRPGGQEYEKSVATSNLLCRFSRPYFVVQPENPAHVQTIVKAAVSNGLKITVKNGGHSFAGFSSTDRGILLDLCRMKNVRLHYDPLTGRPDKMTLEGGAQWGHAYKALVTGRYDGYMLAGGRCPTVGVSGFVLGGGLGPFTRELGLGCDPLTEVSIVTADGKIVVVGEKDDKKSDKGKLFWALRGAGCGSFGIVVELKMKVQRVQSHVVTGRFTYNLELNEPFVDAMKKIYRFNWPDTATIDTHWICDVKPNRPDSSVRFVVYFDGDKQKFDAVIDQAIGPAHREPRTTRHHQGVGSQPILTEESAGVLRVDSPSLNLGHLELAQLIKERTLPEPSTLLLHETLVLQWWEEILRALPTNKSYSIYSSFVFERKAFITDSATDIVRARLDAFQREFIQDTATLEVTFVHAGGKASSVESDETAFPWRHGTYFTYIMIRWEDKWLSFRVRKFMDAFKAQLRPLSLERRAAYVNFTDVALRDYASAYYGQNYHKLQQVKKTWDKFDYFHPPQGVRLPGNEEGVDYTADGVDWVELIHRRWENRVGLPPPRNEFPDVIRNIADLKF